MFNKRLGEISADIDPATSEGDAGLVFTGRIRTAWKTLDDCPKNPKEARQRGVPAHLEIEDAWRPALRGLQSGQQIHVLYWMGEARRDLVVLHPSHKPAPVGAFALRSPARPNPIALALVRILSLDETAGRVKIDAIDCLDGTALLDIKPWIETVDTPSGPDG